jgi:cytochrome c
MNILRDFVRSVPWGAVAMITALILWMSMREANASADLVRANGCMTCHAVDKKLVGPSFRDVAQRYAKTPNAGALITRSIQSGGGGKWGPVPMPAQKQLTENQAKEIAHWILEQK